MRAAILALALLCAAAAGADAEPVVAKIEATLDLPKDKPYVGEMILLRLRAFVAADIVLDEFRQPPLTNFNWQQLGRDKPVEAMVDGFRVSGIERDIAIYPQVPGRLIIDPFVRHTTIVDRTTGQRVQQDFASKPIYVDVQNYLGVIPPGTWWLPAKSVTITDNWSVQPDEIKPGTLAHRTVVVEAAGVTGDRLPPPPEMRAPGTIAFRGPVNRETIVTEDGPIGRGTYQWDLRPVSSSPAKLPAIHVPWFDTSERRMRDAAIPGIWTAYVGTLVHPSHEKGKTAAQTYLSAGPLLAGAGAFAWMSLVCVYVLTSRRERSGRNRHGDRMVAKLCRAARFRNDDEFHATLARLAQADPVRWARVSKDSLVAARLEALGRARYGQGETGAPSFGPLAEDIRSLWLRPVHAADPASHALPPLDGDPTPPAKQRAAGWFDRVRSLFAPHILVREARQGDRA